MIVVRRFFAVLLVPLFMVFFLATMLIFRVNATFLDPGFYTKTIHDLDVFNFMYDEGIPYAIQQAENNGDVNLNDLPLGMQVTPDQIAGYAKQVFPPDWLEQNVDSVLNAAVPYIVGDTNNFTFTVQLNDRVDALDATLKQVLNDVGAYAVVGKPEFADFVDQQLGVFHNLPFGITLTGDQVAGLFNEVFPEDWLRTQTEQSIDQAASYLTGDSNTVLVLPIHDRVRAALEGPDAPIKQFLRNINVYDDVYKEGIAPQLAHVAAQGNGSISLALAPGFTIDITEQELTTALQAVSPTELQAQVEGAIDAIAPWLLGDAQHFTVGISVADATQLLAPVVSTLLSTKYDNLAPCTAAQVSDFLTNGTISVCRVPGFSLAQVLNALNLDVNAQVAAALGQVLPDGISYTDTQLMQDLSSSDLAKLNQALDYIQNGYVLTGTAVQDYLSKSDPQIVTYLNDIRSNMKDGFTVDAASIENRIDNPAQVDQFNRIRGYVHTGRTWLPALVLLPLIFALLIGLLGGRNWWSRMAWLGVPLFIAGGLAVGVFGPLTTYGLRFTDPLITDQNLPSLIQTKLFAVRDALRASFLTPMAVEAGVIAGLGLAMIVVGIIMSSRQRSQPR